MTPLPHSLSGAARTVEGSGCRSQARASQAVCLPQAGPPAQHYQHCTSREKRRKTWRPQRRELGYSSCCPGTDRLATEDGDRSSRQHSAASRPGKEGGAMASPIPLQLEPSCLLTAAREASGTRVPATPGVA